ncbi:energy coupling factor transporter S component ThiW [uncultured Oscillibacter sp.]|uniref:energy coupling factor transporter S component ThiW n=1 Tax=uncultured Oscillibacter sp. TaxID=876091 RepID=UPI0025E510BE|nr:energy coupling factor transporter S component ThiW [uncultured Oscillibacter sp.]
MKNRSVQKLAIAGAFCALAVVGSMFLTFPVFGSKCAPVQHMVNVLCAVFLGPWYGLAAAFAASLLRNLLGWGSLLAFPGSMCGALLCGLAYWKTKNLTLTLLAEVLGTGVLGGLAAYPVAKQMMGLTPETYTVYIIPFLISTAAGSILAGALVYALQKSGALRSMQSALER